jgi:hypothetical protein
MLPFAAHSHARSEFPETSTSTSVPSLSLPDPVIRGLVIATVIFFISLTALLVFLLCFYRERDERCWPCQLCCWRRRKPRKGLRPVRLGNPDYALNADARHSRTMAGMVSESRGVGLGVSGVSRLETGVIRPKGRVEDDGISVVGDGEERKLENMSPRKSDSEGGVVGNAVSSERNEGESSQE